VASRLSAQSQVAASAGVLAWTEGVGRRALGVERVESDRGMGRKGGEDSRSRGEISSLSFFEGGSRISRSSCSITPDCFA